MVLHSLVRQGSRCWFWGLFVGFGLAMACGTLQRREEEIGPCARFELLRGRAVPPGNISLLFGVRDCDGDPLVGLTSDDFELSEDGRAVSTFESSSHIVAQSQPTDLWTLLLLDLSASIVDSGSIPALQQAATTFVERIVTTHRVGLYVFDGREQPTRLAAFTQDAAELTVAIDSLTRYEPQDRSTNLNGALVTSLQVLDAVVREPEAGRAKNGSLVVFTDGVDEAGRVSNTQALEAVSKSRHAIFAIGLGEAIDPLHLWSLGRDGFESVAADNDMVDAFERTAGRVEAESRRFYLVGYCSPKRAGSHVLSVMVREREGELLFPFDATLFSAGCDPADIVSMAPVF